MLPPKESLLRLDIFPKKTTRTQTPLELETTKGWARIGVSALGFAVGGSLGAGLVGSIQQSLASVPKITITSNPNAGPPGTKIVTQRVNGVPTRGTYSVPKGFKFLKNGKVVTVTNKGIVVTAKDSVNLLRQPSLIPATSVKTGFFPSVIPTSGGLATYTSFGLATTTPTESFVGLAGASLFTSAQLKAGQELESQIIGFGAKPGQKLLTYEKPKPSGSFIDLTIEGRKGEIARAKEAREIFGLLPTVKETPGRIEPFQDIFRREELVGRREIVKGFDVLPFVGTPKTGVVKEAPFGVEFAVAAKRPAIFAESLLKSPAPPLKSKPIRFLDLGIERQQLKIDQRAFASELFGELPPITETVTPTLRAQRRLGKRATKAQLAREIKRIKAEDKAIRIKDIAKSRALIKQQAERRGTVRMFGDLPQLSLDIPFSVPGGQRAIFASLPKVSKAPTSKFESAFDIDFKKQLAERREIVKGFDVLPFVTEKRTSRTEPFFDIFQKQELGRRREIIKGFDVLPSLPRRGFVSSKFESAQDILKRRELLKRRDVVRGFGVLPDVDLKTTSLFEPAQDILKRRELLKKREVVRGFGVLPFVTTRQTSRFEPLFDIAIKRELGKRREVVKGFGVLPTVKVRKPTELEATLGILSKEVRAARFELVKPSERKSFKITKRQELVDINELLKTTGLRGIKGKTLERFKKTRRAFEIGERGALGGGTIQKLKKKKKTKFELYGIDIEKSRRFFMESEEKEFDSLKIGKPKERIKVKRPAFFGTQIVSEREAASLSSIIRERKLAEARVRKTGFEEEAFTEKVSDFLKGSELQKGRAKTKILPITTFRQPTLTTLRRDTLLKDMQAFGFAQPTALKTKQATITQQALVTSLRLTQPQISVQRQSEIQQQQQRQQQTTKQLQQLKLVQITRQPVRIKFPELFPTIEKIPEKTKEPKIPPFIPLPSLKRQRLGETFGYKVFVRGTGKRTPTGFKPGEFIQATKGVLSRKEALAFGQSLVSGTAKRTFKIVPTVGKRASVGRIPKFRSEMFRTKGRTFIEKSRFAIDQPGERKAITEKGISTLKGLRLTGFKPFRKKPKKTKKKKTRRR